jgi:hypothetical protein
MSHVKTVFFLCAAFFGFTSSPVNAQLCLKTGYNISLLTDPGFNEVVSLFSSTQPYKKPFPKLTWMHGFETGLRYKVEEQAMELNYQVVFQKLKAKVDSTETLPAYTDKILLSVQSLGLAYQYTSGVMGFGTELQYQWYTTKTDLAQVTPPFRQVQDMLALKLYLMITLSGGGPIDASLQPYFLFPFGKYDLDPLSYYLNQEAGPAEKKWTRFGISVLFYNLVD